MSVNFTTSCVCTCITHIVAACTILHISLDTAMSHSPRSPSIRGGTGLAVPPRPQPICMAGQGEADASAIAPTHVPGATGGLGDAAWPAGAVLEDGAQRAGESLQDARSAITERCGVAQGAHADRQPAH